MTLAPSRPHTAALQLEAVAAGAGTAGSGGGLGGRRVLLVVSESHIEAAGAFGQAAGGRSSRRGQAGLRRQELAGLLEELVGEGSARV
jgi:hypothetical protein